MLQPGDLQLNHVRQEISRRIAFPEELADFIDEAAGHALLAEIAACSTTEDRLTLTYSLSRKRLNDLFAAVLTLSAAAGEDQLHHLLEIFRLRATLSLTRTAWAYYQRQYPNDRLGRVLFTLVRALPEQDNDLDFLKELKQVTIDHLLPRRLTERLHASASDRAIRLPIRPAAPASTDNQENLLGMVPLSRLREQFPLLAAYTSLSALPDEQKASNSCLTSGLCGYMVRMAMMPDTPFAAAFMTAWFQRANDQDLYLNADLFIQALRVSRHTSQQALLRRFLNDYRLAERWEPINQVILALFGVPELKQAVPPEQRAPEKPEPSARPAVRQDPPPAPQQPQPDVQPQTKAQTSLPYQEKGIFSWLRGRRNRKDSALEAEQKQEAPAAPVVQPQDKSVAETNKADADADKAPRTDTGEHEQDNPLSSSVQPDSRFSELEQTLLQGIHLPEDIRDTADGSGTNIWQQLDSDSALRFRQWAFLDRINRHGADSRKLGFLRRYALQIQSVRDWDKETLLIELDGFYLVSHSAEPGSLWYYDSNTLNMLAEASSEVPLNRPQQPLINSREAMLQDTVSNIVHLPLDAINLLYSHDFIRRIEEDRRERSARKTP